MRPKKALGQHFLHDRAVLGSIVRALEVRPDDLVAEIGPGTGRLTALLLPAVGADRLLCIEQDPDMIAHLAQKFPEVRVLRGDAAQFDFAAAIPGGGARVVGNLPYNASTAIYFHLLEQRHLFARMVLMFQREVAERLVAAPGSRAFGPPSVLTALLSNARIVLRVPPRAFRPPPRVDSAVLRVDPLPEPRYGVREDEVAAFNVFVHALFRQRRKTVLNNLKAAVGADALPALEDAGVDPQARAEVIAPDRLVDLWRHVVSRRA